MFDGQDANPLLEALKHRQKLALHVFLGVILLIGIAAFLTRQYSATAVVALNPHASLKSDGHPRSAAEVAWTALTDKQITSLIGQFQLDNGIIQMLGQNRSFTYLRSQISMHQVNTPGSSSPELAVSFTGQSRSAAMGVANAIAEILAQAKAPARSQPPPIIASQPVPPNGRPFLNDDLGKDRPSLAAIDQSQNGTEALKQELQGLLRTKAQIEAAQQADMIQLAQLARENERITLAAARVRSSASSAGGMARAALVEHIQSAKAHLAELRRRYTEQYPDVQDAEAALTRLQAQLERMPREKSRQNPISGQSSTVEKNNIARQQAQLRADQQRLEQSLQANRNRTRELRRQIARSSALTQDSASQQQTQPRPAPAQPIPVQDAAHTTSATPAAPIQLQLTPLFIVIQSATSADALGVATKPAFWLLSLLAGLIAAMLVVFLAEQVSPTVSEEDVSPRKLHHRV